MESIFKSDAFKSLAATVKADASSLFKNAASNVAGAVMDTKAGETFKTAATNTALSQYTPHILLGIVGLLIIGSLAARHKVLK